MIRDSGTPPAGWVHPGAYLIWCISKEQINGWTLRQNRHNPQNLRPLKNSTMAKTAPKDDSALTESEEVFEKAAEVFRVMSAPMRLRIISALCNAEKNVGELLAEIDTTQPNMSQHLNTLYQAGVVGKRRDGVQIYYRIINERVVTLCRAVCVQIASESD